MNGDPDRNRRSPAGEMTLDWALTSMGTLVAIEALLRAGLRECGLLERFEETVNVFLELVRFGLTSGAAEVKCSVERHESIFIHFEVSHGGPELPGELSDRLESLTGGGWNEERRAGGHVVWATVRRPGDQSSPTTLRLLVS